MTRAAGTFPVPRPAYFLGHADRVTRHRKKAPEDCSRARVSSQTTACSELDVVHLGDRHRLQQVLHLPQPADLLDEPNGLLSVRHRLVVVAPAVVGDAPAEVRLSIIRFAIG